MTPLVVNYPLDLVDLKRLQVVVVVARQQHFSTVSCGTVEVHGKNGPQLTWRLWDEALTFDNCQKHKLLWVDAV